MGCKALTNLCYVVRQLCTTHTYEQFLKLTVDFVFRRFRFAFCVLFYCFVSVLFAFAVLGLVSSELRQEIG